MHYPGEFGYLYLVTFVSLHLSKGTIAAALGESGIKTINSCNSPTTFTKNETFRASTLTNAHFQTQLAGGGIPVSVLRKGQETGPIFEKLEKSRARRNTMERSPFANQNEENLLRLLSFMVAKDGNNLYPGQPQKGHVDFPSLFHHGHGAPFNFPVSDLENYDEVEEEEEEPIELGSFGLQVPATAYTQEIPVHHVEWETYQRKPGHERVHGLDSRGSRVDKDWIVDEPIHLYAHKMKRNEKMMKRKNFPYSVPKDTGSHQYYSPTQLLTGPQQQTEPNIPIFRRPIL